MTWELLLNSVLLGAGLAMDAFSVSVANGLRQPDMRKRRMLLIAGTFALFQFLMPFLGWLGVHFLSERFEQFSRRTPWFGFALLLVIGTKMVVEAVRDIRGRNREEEGAPDRSLGAGALLLQGVATSIDALSVGFTTAGYAVGEALGSAAIIGTVTFAICVAGVRLGRIAGAKLSGYATLAGGILLILIGIEILLTGIL